MKINLEVFPPSCPLQIQGTFGDSGVYYRARSGRWELWVNPDGEITEEWLAARIYSPTRNDVLEDEGQEDDLVFALATISSEIVEP